MSSYLTSSTLIDSVRRRAHIPESQLTFLDADFLAFANEEMLIGLVPSILKTHEEFYAFPFTIPLLDNTTQYEIPDRSIGTKLRTLFFKDIDGNAQEMARILPDNIPYFQNRSSVNWPRAYYLQNNFINLVPDMGTSPQGSLIGTIFLRPNQLVDASRIGVITNISSGVLTLSSIPSNFTLGVNYDLLETSNGHMCRAINIVPTGINMALNTITFNAASVPSTLVVGDQIALSGECMIPQMPDDLHVVLAQRVACRCLEAQKDSEGLQAANAKLQEMEINIGMLIDNRTEGQPQKINNLRSALRSGKYRRRRRNSY